MLKPVKERFDLSDQDLTNGYIVLANLAVDDSVLLVVKGDGPTIEGRPTDSDVDYTVSIDPNTGNTKLTFLAGLTTKRATPLTNNDVMVVQYLTNVGYC